ncbi:MAG: hypothetical protein LBV04_07045 [Deferribacteraceae bacterium]|jgi:hypothetical protein|nr:hypothetical protein [Deferribacteraceae bacterium]
MKNVLLMFACLLILPTIYIEALAQGWQTLAMPPAFRKPPNPDDPLPPPPTSITAEPMAVFADGWPKAINFTFTPDSSSCTNVKLSPSCSRRVDFMPSRANQYSQLVIQSIHKGQCTVIFTCGGQEFSITIEKE